MKIFSTNQIREADSYTIINEPVRSVDLMERAAMAIAGWFTDRFSTAEKILIFSGPGNNGGDGLALGRLLAAKGFQPEIFLLMAKSGYSSDTSVNLERLRAMNISPKIILSDEDFPAVSPSDIVVDALFGTGLSRPLDGLPAALIMHLNGSSPHIVSVDIPSGLFGDDNRQNPGSSVIMASHTLSFQFPKLAFMFPENEKFTGEWEILPIGIHPRFIEETQTPWYFTESRTVKPKLRPRRRFAHKGNFGHCLLISGSYGRMGAALLAAESCLRSGTGLLTVHVPVKGCEIVQTYIPEAMVSIDNSEICFTTPPPIGQFNAIAVGPALGTSPSSQKALLDLLRSTKAPMVIDADAINIISLNKEWLELLPENTILTPHPGEFDRLAGKHKNSHDRLTGQMEICRRYNIIIVLKGAYTSIATPGGTCHFNSTGNHGMATAGSGDVLTGILLSLLGQGYEPADAAITGVYLHGLAGDLACDAYSSESLIASDISKNLGKAYNLLRQQL